MNAVVKTRHGEVRGRVADGVNAFKGCPDPTMRWKRPELLPDGTTPPSGRGRPGRVDRAHPSAVASEP